MASRRGELADVYSRSPDEARALLRHALHQADGYPDKATRYLGITRAVVWYWLRLLGMAHEPKAIRNARKARYRLTDVRRRQASA